MTHAQYIAGVDEVGKGPLAGPVAVAAVLAPKAFNFNIFSYLADSKKLSEKRREAIFEQAIEMQKDGLIRFSVQYQSPAIIDTKGIEEAIRRALVGVLVDIEAKKKPVHIYLDGRLKAPETFSQETIVGGDGSIPIISLASVIAKVSRDRLMCDYCRQYPEYGFSKHKGYGTKTHIAAIREHGVSPIHRKSFLTRIAP